MEEEIYLKDQIEKLGPWLMRHEIKPGLFTSVAPGSAGARQKEWFSERASVIFNFLKQVFKNNLRNESFLDIGCASGYFLFEALKIGIRYGVGAEPREIHLQQAEFLRNHYEYTNCEFRKAQVKEVITWPEKFDVILFLDVLQIISDPINTLVQLYRMTNKVLIVESGFPDFSFDLPYYVEGPSPVRQALIWLRTEDPESHNKKGVEGIVLTPTFNAVLEMLRYAGFPIICVLKTPSEWVDPVLPLGTFSKGQRAIFAAFKQEDLLNRDIEGFCIVLFQRGRNNDISK